MYHERTKHIDIKYHSIRDIITEGKVLAQKINTKKNPAGMFTKPLPVYKFKQCLDLVGICCWWFKTIGAYVKKMEQFFDGTKNYAKVEICWFFKAVSFDFYGKIFHPTSEET